ncbi:MAG: imidazole glycerol phosphate synthase subunit HisH [Candidatus Lokiarchaeota archaeon]|nr:imidazole glycerol phosphate synthase subunit HisH [Candidatus Lokiarchaeota archaeon]
MGNLKSIYKCLKHVGVESIITDEPIQILEADGVILPGVGAFGDAMKHLNEKGLVPVINELVQERRPLLGICLGQQLLFSISHEMGLHEGLGVFNGEVVLFEKSKVDKIPQIGWNSVRLVDKDHFLVQNIPDDSYFYFVHSYHVVPKDTRISIGITQYGEVEYSSIVGHKNIIATQFHPEKSSKHGIKIYENFIEFCRK